MPIHTLTHTFTPFPSLPFFSSLSFSSLSFSCPPPSLTSQCLAAVAVHRYMQRRIIMADPHWAGGRYYGKKFPVMGMKHAREIATISYRSGPEWEQRFSR